MAMLKGFSGLALFKLPNIFFLKLKRILGTVNKQLLPFLTDFVR